MTDLTGKTAVVTGASRGIGSAIARALSAAGATVIGTVNRSQDQADRLSDETGIAFEVVDLEQPDAAGDLAARLPASIDILVNNAGVATYIPWGENSAATIDREFAVNVRAPLLLTQALAPRLAEGGRVIFLSSIVALRSFADGALVSYAATKGAVDAAVRHLAGPLGTRGITVNAVAPGAIATDMSAWLREEGGPEQAHGIQALKRVGQPEDIADAVVFLASDAGRWVTGQTLQVGGGTLV